MEQLMQGLQINCHSSIRLEAGPVLYFDPFRITREAHDADVIFLTHDHYDHFSPEDIAKVRKPDTLFVAPEGMRQTLADYGRVCGVKPGGRYDADGISVEAVPAYNADKAFHPRAKGWVGYVVNVGGRRVYVAGDTDALPENRRIVCDLALLPVGGTYTMTASEAAGFANALHPAAAIPTHYGSVVGTMKDGAAFKSLLDRDIACALLIK